jgi:hypothetical protein
VLQLSSQVGHIRPNCPLLNPKSESGKKLPKLGMIHGPKEGTASKVLSLVANVRGPNFSEEPCQIILEVDTCSEVNLVGANWMPLLALCVQGHRRSSHIR